MQSEIVKAGIRRYLRPFPLIVCLSLVGMGSSGAVLVVKRMDILTFVASLNTQQVTVEELQQGKLSPIILIDVRSPEEYAQDRIASSILIPLTDLQGEFGIKQVQQVAEQSIREHGIQPTLLLYCTSGLRSFKAYKRLEKTGLNLVVLSGGITAWREAIPPAKDASILAPML